MTPIFPRTQVHVTEASSVADHCTSYALSHPENHHFCHSCSHPHNLACSSCEGLKSVLSSIEAVLHDKATMLSDEERDDMMYAYQQPLQAIEAWEARQLRSLQQNKCCVDILWDLTSTEILITQYRAMILLPQKYRETKANWYGKQGIFWHISVLVRRGEDENLEHQMFVHIARNCSQDSNVVLAIVEHTLHTLKAEHLEIAKVLFRQDNAGCHKSGTLLAACSLIQQTTGIQIGRVDFSDAPGRKGPCDRKAATIKARVWHFVNEGHDILTADD